MEPCSYFAHPALARYATSPTAPARGDSAKAGVLLLTKGQATREVELRHQAASIDPRDHAERTGWQEERWRHLRNRRHVDPTGVREQEERERKKTNEREVGSA